MRLLLDEMWSPAVADQLRARGHDVQAVAELAALRGQPDETVFLTAQQEQRAIVTENIADFLVLARSVQYRGGSHWGIVLTPPSFGRARPDSAGRLVRALDAVIREGFDQRDMERWLR